MQWVLQRMKLQYMRTLPEKSNSKMDGTSVEWPVKESHPVLPDNYTLCKKRLDGDEELKRKYEKVFK